MALLTGVYAWAGYWLVPRLIQTRLPPAIAAATGQRLTIGAVAVQPFRLAVDVSGIALTEPDGTPLLGAKRLHVDAELASVWRRGVVLRAVVLDEPAVNLVLRPDGSVNLVSALWPQTARAPAAREPGRPLLISIRDIEVRHGVIDAADLRRDHPLRERLAPIDIRVQNFATTAGGEGSFHLAGRGARGEALTLDGQVSVRPFSLAGTFALQGLDAGTAWRLAGEYDRIAPPAGTLDLRTNYRIAAAPDGVLIALDGLAFEARDLALRGAGADEDWIKVASLAVSGASVDLQHSLVRLPGIHVDGVDAHGWIDADGKVSFAALAPAARSASPTAGSQPWRIEAPRLRVTGSRVALEDRRTPEPVRYLFAPVEFSADGYATGAAAVKLALRSGFNESGHIAIDGEWRLDHSGGAFAIDARALPVELVQPYLDRSTDLVLRGGEFAAKGRLAIERPVGGTPQFGFDGSARLVDFHSVDRALREDFVRFGDLALAGVTYRSSPASLRIRDIVARGAYFKFVIAPDQTTNIADVLSPPRAGRAAAASAARAAPPRPALRSRIDRVRFIDSSANFADLSIRPNFATGIEQLAGTVTGLSSEPDARASVELDGKVDRYAPVEIRGEVNYLASSAYTHLFATFSNIELPTFTPYSGKFMGYEIEKGKLNAKFEYLIENRRLDARHRFMLDQFTLGKRVESDDAIHLPIRLAIALLKDRNGVIDIDLPVSGSLDDPQFRVGPLVWKALRNLLVKIVSAPFALLGSLFGAGEEVRFVDFAFGSAVLDPAARERLANVGRALVERPQLRLEIPLVADAVHDRAALAGQHFDTLLGGPAVHVLRASDPLAYQRALDAAWRTVSGEKHAPRPERGKDEEREAWMQRCIDTGEAALRGRIVVPDSEVAELARQRAGAVRDALVDATGLDPARVFIVTGAPDPGAPNAVRLALEVE